MYIHKVDSSHLTYRTLLPSPWSPIFATLCPLVPPLLWLSLGSSTPLTGPMDFFSSHFLASRTFSALGSRVGKQWRSHLPSSPILFYFGLFSKHVGKWWSFPKWFIWWFWDTFLISFLHGFKNHNFFLCLMSSGFLSTTFEFTNLLFVSDSDHIVN